MDKKKVIALLAALSLAFCTAACTKDSDAQEIAGGESSIMGFAFDDICDFTAADKDGTDIASTDLFAGKDVTVLNIWATWCPPCIGEMEDLGNFARTLPENVQFLTFCLDGIQEPEEMERILSENGVDCLTLVYTNGDLASVLAKVQYIPTTLFVDEEGHQLCEAFIGAQSEFADSYTQRINECLESLGKDLLP